MFLDPRVGAPAEGGVAVTPSDSAGLSGVTRYVYVGGAGNLAVTMSDGSDVVFAAVPVGTMLNIRVSKVKATGTTASNIVALF